MITRYLNLERLSEHSEASLILRLMMIANDISVGKYVGQQLELVADKDTKDIDQGIYWYLIRIAYAHLYESLKVIKSATRSKYVGRIIEHNAEAKSSADRLIEILDQKDTQLAAMRDKAAFHYDSSWWKDVLKIMVRHGEKIGSVSIPDNESLPMRWCIADDVTICAYQTHVFKTYSFSRSKDHALELLSEASIFLADTMRDLNSVLIAVLDRVLNDFSI